MGAKKWSCDIMADDKKVFYWADKSSTFGSGTKFGDKVEGLDKTRIEKFLESGRITEEKPTSIESVSETELNKLRMLISKKDEIIEGLEHDLAGFPKTVKNAHASNIRLKESNQKLTEQVEELTGKLEKKS